MENPIKMDDLGGFPIFLGWHPYVSNPFSIVSLKKRFLDRNSLNFQISKI